MRFGVIAPHHRAQASLAAGADYIEPHVVNNLVVEADGQWVPNPDFTESGDAPSFAVLFPSSFRLADPAVDLVPVRSYLELAFAQMARLAEPAAKVVLGSGAARAIPEDVERDVALRELAERLRMAHEVASSHGLELLVEPLHSGETNVFNSIEETVAFLEQHQLFHIRVVADLYHIMLEGESLETVTRFAAWVGHAHIADTNRSAPGLGDWPLDGFIQALKDGGYRGDMSIEGNWSDDFLTDLPAAFRHLRSLVAA